MILNFFKKNDIESFLGIKGIKVIEFFIKKSILSQPELLKDQKALPIQIPKEHLEQWLCHALKAEPRGSGSYPVDIIKNNKWAADVKMVSHKLKKDGNFSTGQSGETSLGQKFVDIGKNLDLYFQNSQFDKILDGYLDVFSKKYKAVEKDYNINIFFYFMFIRVKNKFFLSIVSLDLDKLEKVEVDYSSITNTTLSTKNFINKNNGSVVIYNQRKEWN